MVHIRMGRQYTPGSFRELTNRTQTLPAWRCHICHAYKGFNCKDMVITANRKCRRWAGFVKLVFFKENIVQIEWGYRLLKSKFPVDITRMPRRHSERFEEIQLLDSNFTQLWFVPLPLKTLDQEHLYRELWVQLGLLHSLVYAGPLTRATNMTKELAAEALFCRGIQAAHIQAVLDVVKSLLRHILVPVDSQRLPWLEGQVRKASKSKLRNIRHRAVFSHSFPRRIPCQIRI